MFVIFNASPSFHYHVILRANYEITVYVQKNFPPNQHASPLPTSKSPTETF